MTANRSAECNRAAHEETDQTEKPAPRRITDAEWAAVRPLVLGGVVTAQNEPDRSDIRDAVDALIRGGNDGNTSAYPEPRWSDETDTMHLLHERWRSDGTERRIRSLLQLDTQTGPTGQQAAEQEKGAQSPAAEATPAGDQSATSATPTEAGSRESREKVDAWNGTTTELIQAFERWVLHYHEQVAAVHDWDLNHLGRHFLPAFATVLDMLYTTWDLENGKPWPCPQLLEPMPDDTAWMNSLLHSRAVAIAAEDVGACLGDLERATDMLAEIITRGIPYRWTSRDVRDHLLRLDRDQVRQGVQNVRELVETLQDNQLRTIKQAREEARAHDQEMMRKFRDGTWPRTPTVERGRQKPQKQDGQKRTRRPKTAKSYEQYAIEWAEQHQGTVRAGDVARHIMETESLPPEILHSIRSSTTQAVTRSPRFERSGRGEYRLKYAVEAQAPATETDAGHGANERRGDNVEGAEEFAETG